MHSKLQRSKEPNLKVDVETIPVKGDETKSILRLHIYDGAKDNYSSYTNYLHKASTKASGILTKQIEKEGFPTSAAENSMKQFDKLVNLGFLLPIEKPDTESDKSQEGTNQTQAHTTFTL